MEPSGAQGASSPTSKPIANCSHSARLLRAAAGALPLAIAVAFSSNARIARSASLVAKRSPKLGRPPLPRDVAAIERVELRLTTAVRSQWTAAADREGLSLSDWLREAAELALARGSTR